MAIGLFLVVGAAFMSGSKDLEKRFAFGKDVFTVLVGVLGTVMGFYYGQTAAGAGGAITGSQATNVDSSDGKINRTFKLADLATLAGKPVAFTITATDNDKKNEGKNDKGTFTPTSP